MIESLEKFMQNSLGIYFEKSDSDLMSIFYLNYMVVKLHQVYLQKFGRIPVKKNLHAVIANTNLTLNEEKIVFERLLYWLNVQHEMEWDLQVGVSRNRSFPKVRSRVRPSICEWPGCENTDNLELDHKFPFSFGGESTEKNLQYLCQSCNLQKGSSIISINSWPTDE